jgi:hypothetical protein
MNTASFTAAQLVHDYLVATGDTLSAKACRTLGLPYGKHYLHDLRRRLAALDCPGSVRSGNRSANGPIGSSVPAAAALKSEGRDSALRCVPGPHDRYDRERDGDSPNWKHELPHRDYGRPCLSRRRPISPQSADMLVSPSVQSPSRPARKFHAQSGTHEHDSLQPRVLRPVHYQPQAGCAAYTLNAEPARTGAPSQRSVYR